MKQRDPLVATLLSLFIPFYQIYWLYDTGKQLEAKGAKAPPLILLFAPFIVFLLLIFVIVGMSASGTADGEGSVGGFLVLLILPAMALSLVYYYKFGAAVEQVTNHALTKGLVFILLWFVAPAAVFLTQDKLNALSPQPTAPSQPPIATPPQA